jgi:hypothetical protein
MANAVIDETFMNNDEDGITINETLIKMEPEEMTADPQVFENTGNFVTVLVPENFENDVKPRTCSKCSNVIAGKATKSANGTVICQKCQTSSQTTLAAGSQSKKSLFNAIVHSKTPLPFRCHYCSKVYESKELFYGHIRQHAAKKKNPYLCGMCGKNFKELIQFKKHICARNVLKCNRCSKQFESIFRLENHYLIHSKYKCDECGKCLSSKTVLEEHKRVHTNEYPFKCSICNRQFRQKSKYNGHLFVCKSAHPSSQQNVSVKTPVAVAPQTAVPAVKVINAVPQTVSVKTFARPQALSIKTYSTVQTVPVKTHGTVQTAVPIRTYVAKPIQQNRTIVLD